MTGAENYWVKEICFLSCWSQQACKNSGAFISDSEVEALVNSIKQVKEAEYDQDIIENINDINNFTPDEDLDEYLEKP